MGKETNVVTLLSSRASARCCAPCSLISLLLRSSVVSVCLKGDACMYEMSVERRMMALPGFFLEH
jgi:hypothetical protein